MTWYEKLIDHYKYLLTDGRGIEPTLFLQSKDGELTVIDLSVVPEKDIMVGVMKAFIWKKDPEEYLFITETYVKEVDQNDQSDEALGELVANGTLQVSELPSSQEALVALHGTRKGEKLGIMTFVKKGNKLKFQPIKWLEGDGMKGRFSNLRKW